MDNDGDRIIDYARLLEYPYSSTPQHQSKISCYNTENFLQYHELRDTFQKTFKHKEEP